MEEKSSLSDTVSLLKKGLYFQAALDGHPSNNLSVGNMKSKWFAVHWNHFEFLLIFEEVPEVFASS